MIDNRPTISYNPTVSTSLMTYQSPQVGTLDKESWEMILLALETYVINKETQLIKENAGDTPWRDLEEYNKLIKDIQLYILQ